MSSGLDADSNVIEDLQVVSLVVTRVGDARSNVVSAGSESLLDRMPFRISTYHAGLTCRFVEAAEAVITVFKANQFAAAITLTESAIRTTAALWQLHSKVETAAAGRDGRLLEEYLEQVYQPDVHGRTARASETVSVANFFERANDHFPEFRARCERLLRFDIPEWFGAGQLYVGQRPDACSFEFRRHLSPDDRTIALMASVLKITALAYEHCDRELLLATRRLDDVADRSGEDGATAAAGLTPQPEGNASRVTRLH